MDKTLISQEKINDRCPTWAVAVIARIRDIEIEAGHVTPPGDWQQKDLSTLQGRAFRSEEGPDDAEDLFVELANRLASEGFSPSDTASFVNARIITGMGKLQYCNVDEVLEALA